MWLAAVARDALHLQFHDAAWISDNIASVPTPTSRQRRPSLNLEPSSDYRLQENPSLERVSESTGPGSVDLEATSASPVGSDVERQLLGGDSPTKPPPAPGQRQEPETTSRVVEPMEVVEPSSSQPPPPLTQTVPTPGPGKQPPADGESWKEVTPKGKAPQSRRWWRRRQKSKDSTPSGPQGVSGAQGHYPKKRRYRSQKREESVEAGKAEGGRTDSRPKDKVRRKSADQAGGGERQGRPPRRTTDLQGPTDERGSLDHSGRGVRPDRSGSTPTPGSALPGGRGTTVETVPGRPGSRTYSGVVKGTPSATGVSEMTAVCPVAGCTIPYDNPRGHAFALHVPQTFTEGLDLQEVTARRLAALKLAAVWLLGVRATVQDLATYIQSMGLLTSGSNQDISQQQVEAMRALCVAMGVEPPQTFTLCPLNSPAALYHWRVLLVIVAQLQPAQRESFLGQFQEVSVRAVRMEEVVRPKVATPRVVPEAFDSHFHLDRTRAYLKLRASATLEDVCRAVPADPNKPVRVVGAVAVYCDPGHYPGKTEIEGLRRQGVTVSVGMHPKGVEGTGNSQFQKMRKLVAMPEVTGLGEVGIDHSVHPRFWTKQTEVLSQCLSFLEDRHVLVLHCREMEGEFCTEAYTGMLHQLKGQVKRSQRIHLHCFTSSKAMLESWLREFPETFFGFTALVDSFNERQLGGLQAVPKEKLLLETDAPYFRLPGLKAKCSAPSLIGMVACAVAKKRGEQPLDLLKYTTANARRLYEGGPAIGQ